MAAMALMRTGRRGQRFSSGQLGRAVLAFGALVSVACAGGEQSAQLWPSTHGRLQLSLDESCCKNQKSVWTILTSAFGMRRAVRAAGNVYPMRS